LQVSMPYMFGGLRPTYIDQNYGYFANASPELQARLPPTTGHDPSR
jgi:hypothetical protein